MVSTLWSRPAMEVAATTDRAEDSGADTIVVGLFEGGSLDGPAQALVESGEARGGHRKLAVTHADGRRWLVVGLGPRVEFDAEGARVAAAAAIGRARELGARELCWALSDAEAERVEGVVEGAVLAAYRFTRYQAPPEDEAQLERLVVSARQDLGGRVEEAAVLAAA